MLEHRSVAREALLARIAEQIECIVTIPSLDGPGYMRGHVAFESASDQQGKILDWLVRRLESDSRPELGVVSVGAGSGILDVPMLEAVCRHKRVRYTVVEPFEEQCAKFSERASGLTDSANLEVSIECSTLQRTDFRGQFDFVLAIHSVYYFEELEPALAKLCEMVRPDGEVVIAVAPREEMNRLSELFWRPQHDGSLWFEEDVVAALDRMKISYASERIDARLDASPGAPEWIDIASFLVQSPLRELPSELERLVLDYLEVGGRAEGSSLAVPHPVTMLRVPGRSLG